ncbi:MAG: hypothetical protein DRJ03_05320 [Chloroflexi bacterium]|nr:MAG: hypothetical protein DRJ03_05320 [Chloroflexota bacterium]
MNKAKVGSFEVQLDRLTGHLTVRGPRPFLESEAYRKTLEEIAAGRNPVVRLAVGEGYSLEHSIALALQTAFAAWAGAQELKRRAGWL